MEALIAVACVVQFAWGFLVGRCWLARRFFPWLVRRTVRSALKAALLAVAVQLVGMLAFVLAAFLIKEYAVGVVPLWGVVFLIVMAGMIYAPVMGMAFPDRDHPYVDQRHLLRKAGATLGQERAATWAAGPLTFLGMTALAGANVIVIGL